MLGNFYPDMASTSGRSLSNVLEFVLNLEWFQKLKEWLVAIKIKDNILDPICDYDVSSVQNPKSALLEYYSFTNVPRALDARGGLEIPPLPKEKLL